MFPRSPLVVACLVLALSLSVSRSRAQETCTADAPTSSTCFPPMEYRHLGRTGLKVSVFSFGSWVTFGEQFKEERAQELLERAFELGINFFDNAEAYAYGESERIMGNVIKKSTKWQRSDLVVSTKLFWGGNPDLVGPGGRGVNDVGLSRKHIIEGMAASLERLQLDYVDIVFCHRPDSDTPIEETVRAMDYLINTGKAFYWGTSEWSVAQIEEAHGVANRLGLIAPSVEQPEYSMYARDRFEKEYAPLFEKYGMGTTTWSTLAGGLLTGKYNEGIPEGSRYAMASRSFMKDAVMQENGKYGNWDALVAQLKSLAQLGEQHGCSMAQLALAWAAKNPNVSTVILGGTKVKQLEENIRALKCMSALTEDAMSLIEEILDNSPKENKDWRSHCTTCKKD